MRPSSLRARGAVAALGALCFATALSVSPASEAADSQGTTITVHVIDRTLTYGHRADVRGRVTGLPAGTAVALEQLPVGTGTWQTVAQGVTDVTGRFRLLTVLPGTGAVRVVAGAGQAYAADASAGAPAASTVSSIAVAPDVLPRRRRLDVLTGRRARVTGVVAPRLPGEHVALQRRTRHGWRTLARARTRQGGFFRLRARLRRPLSAAVRVRVAGVGALVTGRERIGRLNVYRSALVSWYGPGFYGQHLGCGGILRYGQLGVAHKTLPCGTPVTLRYGGRSVRVRVIDRGPYVGAREFDLTAATKDRLHFGGVGSILVTT
jgi:rare lipoprotein A